MPNRNDCPQCGQDLRLPPEAYETFFGVPKKTRTLIEVTNPGQVTAEMLAILLKQGGRNVYGFEGDLHLSWNRERLVIEEQEQP